MKPRRVDLHLHTHFSDGTFAPEEVIRRARAAGLSAVSVTDHDALGSLPAARQEAGGFPEVIAGVELTVAYEGRELHVLGYGFRETDPSLNRFLTQARHRRQERIQAMIDRLKEQGVDVSLKEVQALAGEEGSIGRPHLAEMLLQRGVVRTLPEAFERFIGDRAPCFVKRAILTVPEAVRLIREAGGAAILAHPHRMVEDSWIPRLAADGIQGIEVFHPDHEPAVAEKYRRMAQEMGLLMTGGSDCHGLRKHGGPFIGTISVPYELLERLKACFA